MGFRCLVRDQEVDGSNPFAPTTLFWISRLRFLRQTDRFDRFIDQSWKTEEDGVLGEWETHFVIARTLFEENYSGKLQAGCTLRPDCESG